MWSKTKENERKRLICRLVYHCLFLVYNTFLSVYGLKIIINFTDVDIKKSLNIANIAEFYLWYGTHWNMLYHTIYFNLALTYDVLEWRNKHLCKYGEQIKYIRDVHFNGITVPNTFIIVGFFWITYAYDREMVFSKDLDPYAPGWYNHCLHTLISVVLIIEAILEPRVKPTNEKLELTLDAASAIIYFACYYCLYFTTGRWLYPLFGKFNWWQCTLLQTFVFLLFYVYYVMQFVLSRWIHGDMKETDDVLHETKNVKDEVSDLNDSINSRVKTKEAEVLDRDDKYEDIKANENETRNGKGREVEKHTKNEIGLKNNFGDKEWSLKYRLIRDKFENFSRL